MKNLAFMEIHKLSRLTTMQGQSVANIERAALDFLDFYPGLDNPDDVLNLCILMGAERGFCGDFNEKLINAIATKSYHGVIAIGNRLCNRLEGVATKVIATLEGANVAEEVPAIISRLLDTLSQLPNVKDYRKATAPTLQLTVIYHDSAYQIRHRQVFPPLIPQQDNRVHYESPPILNLIPDDFFIDLVNHYVFAVLHEILYTSLNVENQHRLQHLEAAVNHLDDETIKLQKKSQIYRQEEITEEIEVILLNAENNLLDT
jgi:F-type H+-transporting ATPase subunit gamma